MAITSTISENLAAWMAISADLNTLKKLAARSGVGFGTVRRMKNGDGNPTIKNITDVAKAFGKKPEDLLLAATAGDAASAAERCLAEPPTPTYTALMIELTKVAETIDDRGMHILIDKAEEIAARHPRQKERGRVICMREWRQRSMQAPLFLSN